MQLLAWRKRSSVPFSPSMSSENKFKWTVTTVGKVSVEEGSSLFLAVFLFPPIWITATVLGMKTVKAFPPSQGIYSTRTALFHFLHQPSNKQHKQIQNKQHSVSSTNNNHELHRNSDTPQLHHWEQQTKQQQKPQRSSGQSLVSCKRLVAQHSASQSNTTHRWGWDSKHLQQPSRNWIRNCGGPSNDSRNKSTLKKGEETTRSTHSKEDQIHKQRRKTLLAWERSLHLQPRNQQNTWRRNKTSQQRRQEDFSIAKDLGFIDSSKEWVGKVVNSPFEDSDWAFVDIFQKKSLLNSNNPQCEFKQIFILFIKPTLYKTNFFSLLSFLALWAFELQILARLQSTVFFPEIPLFYFLSKTK